MTLLRVDALEAWYGDFQALFGIDLTVDEGETVAVIGSNGAGKSTFLKAVVGLLPSRRDAIHFDGREAGALTAHTMVRRGVSLVPEGRRLFPSLSVEENLRMGAYGGRKGPWTLDAIYGLFPILKERRHYPATSLSGGQQQMVAIGRALMANPRLLLCDEISLGLAPVVVKEIYGNLHTIIEGGTSAIIVEQDIGRAMQAADRFYCFQEGRISLQGRPDQVTREEISAAYFGV